MNNHQERIERMVAALITSGQTDRYGIHETFNMAERIIQESDRRYREVLGDYDPNVAMPVFDTVRK